MRLSVEQSEGRVAPSIGRAPSNLHVQAGQLAEWRWVYQRAELREVKQAVDRRVASGMMAGPPLQVRGALSKLTSVPLL